MCNSFVKGQKRVLATVEKDIFLAVSESLILHTKRLLPVFLICIFYIFIYVAPSPFW